MAVLKEAVEDFKEVMPLVEELHNPALKNRHWGAIMDLIGADDSFRPDEDGVLPDFSVTDLLGFNLVGSGGGSSAASARGIYLVSWLLPCRSCNSPVKLIEQLPIGFAWSSVDAAGLAGAGS